MDKIKWKYDKTNKQWYANEESPYANNGAVISKAKYSNSGKPYVLHMDASSFTPRFKKLASAKKVFELINND